MTDPVRLVLLGTAGGSPYWVNSGRAGVASALVVGDRYYLVDTGRGVLRRIYEAGLGNHESGSAGPLAALRAVFLTHLHSDHVVDLNNVLSAGMHNGLDRVDRPVPIFGPGNRGGLPPVFGDRSTPTVTAPDNPTPGTAEMVDLLVRAFATDFNDRAFDGGYPPPGELFYGVDVPIPAEYLADPDRNPHPPMSPVPFYEDERVQVSTILVRHAPMFPALGYRFDTDAGSVVFSGDTGPSENLVALARRADVLVHEVIDTAWAEQRLPPPRSAEQEGLFRHLLDAHTPVEQVGAIAGAAEVGTLVLSPLVPGNWPDEGWQRARDGFSGRFIVGHDLAVIDIKGDHRPS